MASRHDIVSITFQANAGKANVALQALQTEAKKSSDRVTALKKQLEDGLKANLPTSQIQKIKDDIKSAEKEVKQWNNAYKELTKGVRTLDEAVKQFNAGTLGQMSAAFNKAAVNAAKLAQTKMTPGTQEWKEMDALIVEAQSNVLKANADINGLITTIKKGGAVSKSTLTQAKTDLQQLLTLEVQGTAEWNTYNKQLKAVDAELLKLATAEQKAAQADKTTEMTKRMKNLKTESSAGLAEMKRYWQTMVAGAEKGSAELTKYENNLKKVVNQERQRATASAEQMIGSPQKYGVEQIRQAVQEMNRLRESVQEGIPAWQHYNKLVKQGEAYLQEYAEREKIARGEAVSLSEALKISANAGGKGFVGTAKQLQQAEAALQKALTTAKKGSPEWVKYQQALAKVRVEMQNAGMTSERMRDILAKPANAKNLNELTAAVKRAKAELDLMAGTVGKNSKEYANLASQTKKAEIQMKSLQAQSHGTASAFDKAWSRLKTYIGLYMGAAVAMQKLTATMGDLLELSDKMGEVRKTTGFTADEVGRLTENLKKMDTRTGIVGLLELSAAAGQLGLKTEEDVQGFTEAANKLMVALPEMGREAATQMLKVALATGEIDKIRKQMAEGTIEGSSAVAVAMEKVGSTIDRLRATSASAAPAITDFVQRVGAVGAQSGISIDQIAALGSTVDALGMRVEMSATALSRMIPAIKNNAFEIAQAIGVTPEALRNLFETGRGMEAILMIFQHIKDAGMDDESIEQMLGIGNMKEIMKDLNQQGARAGIVFASLSQNVDELRRQLGVAAEAYEENIAIQNEYNKMNETTAAKWERLKNQLEEMFVGDQAQKVLGGIIESLRWIVDLISGDNGISDAIRKVIVVIAIFKANLGVAVKDAIMKVTKLGAAFKSLKAAIWSINGIWNALAVGATFLIMKIVDLNTKISETSKAVGGLEAEMTKELSTMEKLFRSLAKAREEERLSAEAIKESTVAEAVKTKHFEEATKATEDYMKSLNLVEMVEKRRAETQKFFAENMKEMSESTKEAAETEKGLIEERKALIQQQDIVKRIEKQRAEIAEALNARHMQEVMVVGKRITAEQNLSQQYNLIKMIEEQRTELAEALNAHHLQEVVITGKRIAAEQNLAQQSELVRRIEERHAELAEILNTHHLQEVVVTGKRITAEQNLVRQSELVKMLEERRAEIAEVLNTRHLEGVTVIGKRVDAEENLLKQGTLIKMLEERRAEIAEVLNTRHLQEVVVTGKRVDAEQNLAQQYDLIRMLEERRAEIAEVLNTQHLKEVVVIGKRVNVEKNLSQQYNLVNMLEERRTEIAEVLTVKTNNLSSSTEKLAKAESDVAAETENVEKGMHRVNIEGQKSADIIRQINSKYSTYLGYMLSETASAEQLAKARELINAKLRETITLKQREAAMNDIEQEYGKNVRKQASGVDDQIQRIFRGNDEAYARVSVAVSEAAQKYSKDAKGFEKALKKILTENKEYIDKSLISDVVTTYAQSDVALSNEQAIKSLTSGLVNSAKGYREAVEQYQNEEAKANRVFDARENVARKESRDVTMQTLNSVMADWKDLLSQYQSAEGEQKQKLAVELYKQQRSYANLFANNADYFAQDSKKGTIERNIEKMKTYEKGLRAVAGEAIRAVDAAERTQSIITNTNFSNESPSAKNPWGSAPSAESTDYATWDVNELVARRNQMDKFKNVLKPDTDVMAVLAEDKALMKAITNKEITADWKEVLNWYNKERLKIQEELKSERFSTNEGHWRDEADKKGRKRRNVFQESDYALAELDRYYSRRKEAMEKARAEENISEEMYNRQTEILEQEHLERRAKLRGTFTGEVSKEETEMFRQWWANLEKADELDHVPWDTVESEWAKAIASQIGKNNLNMQKDLTQLEAITMKHVNQIANIIAKERPYDGITENLQANLTKLDILFADMGALTKEQLEDGSMTKELSRRLSFLLDETEHAYTLTAEQLMADMGKKGFQEWADALTNNENGEELKRQLLAQLQKAYDAVQDAIKKEANILKKQAEIQWNDTTMPNGKSRKQTFEATLSALGLQEDQVKRANSLIGAGYASERVADKLAIKQMQVRLAMQEQYYNLIRKTGLERIAQLEKQGKLEDAAHLRKSLDLALSEELKKTEEQRVAIANQLEESQNRLYTALKEWSTLLASSLQSVFEASHAGDKEYYNELAKLNLTGKGGPGAGTYIIIDNEGTSEASAHYEYLDEREALERQREIERQNAQAEAWEKVMDDFNMKLSETITDQINAMMQNASIDANTQAVIANTEALYSTAGRGEGVPSLAGAGNILNAAIPTGDGGEKKTPVIDAGPLSNAEWEPSGGFSYTPIWQQQGWTEPPVPTAVDTEAYTAPWAALADASNEATKTVTDNNKKTEKSTQSTFAAMTQAANLYGVAYQAMSNDNLDTSQKFQMIALQAAGNAAISGLTAALASDTAETASSMPAILAKCLKINPIWGSVLFAAITATLGGLMGMAASKITKSKSQIAQATGASASAGRLATGMLTYAEGNVNEFTDPASLHEGRQYNVDAADGRTYRARYMGRNPKTHLTNGPEFHLSGERGREMIIDAGTTRQITMNDGEIWRTIQTLSGGGRMSLRGSRRGRGVAAFAGGNVEDFEGVDSGELTPESGFGAEQIASLQACIDRQSDLLDRALKDGIKGVFDVYGKGGLVDSYDTGKKTLKRHGERY